MRTGWKFLIIVSIMFMAHNVYGDVGYVAQNVYYNSWRVNVNTGNVIVDLVLPYPIYLDSIIVGGDNDGQVLLNVGIYNVNRYLYTAFFCVGDFFVNPIYVAAGVHVTVVLESGTAGWHSVSISGHF